MDVCRTDSAQCYVAERYVPGLTLDRVMEDAARLCEATRELRIDGLHVRYLSSTFLSSEETVLDLLEAGSTTDLEELDRRSSVRFDRVSAAVVVVPSATTPAEKGRDAE